MIVKIGDVVNIGEVKIERKNDNLKLSDRYSNLEYIVDPNSKVELLPLPPFYVPQKVANHLMLEFEKPLVINGRWEVWAEGPYEIDVRIDGRRAAILSPIKVKHALYGDMTEGVVCRHFKTRIYNDVPKRKELAAVKIVFNAQPSGRVDKLVMHGAALTIFEKDDRYYYEIIDVQIKESSIIVNLTDKSPVPNAIEVHRDESMLKARYVMRW